MARNIESNIKAVKLLIRLAEIMVLATGARKTECLLISRAFSSLMQLSEYFGFHAYGKNKVYRDLE